MVSHLVLRHQLRESQKIRLDGESSEVLRHQLRESQKIRLDGESSEVLRHQLRESQKIRLEGESSEVLRHQLRESFTAMDAGFDSIAAMCGDGLRPGEKTGGAGT